MFYHLQDLDISMGSSWCHFPAIPCVFMRFEAIDSQEGEEKPEGDAEVPNLVGWVEKQGYHRSSFHRFTS